MKLFSDTSEKVRAIHDDMLRRKSAQERLQMAQTWTIGAQNLAFAAMRQRRPELTDDEIWLKLAGRRLGADVVRKVYGREP
ncbi:MAG TPA: hypothetical protein VF846_01930 [Thermoanaerobaculia bacterium]|jgi:hypothetical protein